MAIASLLNPAQPLEAKQNMELMEFGGLLVNFGSSFHGVERPKTKLS